MRETLLAVDGNSLMHRAFHALPLMDAGGVYTNAVHGFLSMLLKAMQELSPRYIAVAFDEHAPTFRHTAYADYKAGRRATPEELRDILAHHVQAAEIPRMVVTMGAQGAVYAMQDGSCGICPAGKVDVKDTTGAGDAFFAGITMGLTYGKTMDEACEIGTRLSASVICTSENVCPRFLPSEFGLEPGRAAGEQLTFDI